MPRLQRGLPAALGHERVGDLRDAFEEYLPGIARDPRNPSGVFFR